MNATVETLTRFGADPANLRLFEGDGPELLPYATLTAQREKAGAGLSAIIGIYEWQDAPLVLLVDADKLGAGKQLERLRRLAAMRGDIPYLGVLLRGSLDIYRVALDSKALSVAKVPMSATVQEPAATFAHLANLRPGTASLQRTWVSTVVLDLLDKALAVLTTECKVPVEDAISLVGRALFVRFLTDRGLLPKKIGQSGEGSAFANLQAASITSTWLDKTFNGDFLPLKDDAFETLPPSGYDVLTNITRGTPGGQFAIKWAEDWANLNFAHIPVGVLSQAYERYQAKNVPATQKRQGGYYTPRSIADLLIRGAFAPLAAEGRAASARVLDPAVGAGVFLIAAYRRLVAERWRAEGKRPDTKVLRAILYSQLTGLDIDEAALRFAALGLYLMAIELDPEPEPVGKLIFPRNLRGVVLHKVGASDETRSLGSLDPDLSVGGGSRYDLVIGNPPWASGTMLPGWDRVLHLVTSIAEKRTNGKGIAPKLPNEGLDLPFIWRAMEWARDGGQIAFALHARILFQQGDGMPQARQALFSAVDVTGILNGAEMRQTNVWPDVDAPFCLVFARNRVPDATSAFKFLSPRLEDGLNSAGTMRIDASRADVVTPAQINAHPDILKLLFRGGEQGTRLMLRVQAAALTNLDEYWTSQIANTAAARRTTGNGYQKLRPSSRTRKNADGLPGADAAYLHGLPEITADAMADILIDVDALPIFNTKRIHDPRDRELFRGPMLLVRQSPPAGLGRLQVAVCDSDAIYSETYYGYSARTHMDGARLVRFLALVVGSRTALWATLLTSGKFGLEREVVEKTIIDQMPIPDFDTLSENDLIRADHLFSRLVESNDASTWAVVDEWVAGLYALKPWDMEVINDTLTFDLPFARSRWAAEAPPDASAVEAFRTTLRDELSPWSRRAGMNAEVTLPKAKPASPWRGLEVVVQQAGSAERPAAADEWIELLKAADQVAAVQLILRDPENGRLWVERLNQARYWTKSQARQLARHLAWEHVDILTSSTKA